MKAEFGLYTIIYEFYEARILCGYYHFGDPLPSLPQIGATFHVAPSTARTALALLEEKGYVAVDARKVAKVVYRAEASVYRKNTAMMLAPRWQEILELERAGYLLLKPCWEAGLKGWTQDEWEAFLEDLTKRRPDLATVWIHFFLTGLSKLHNQLVLNLYWEVVNFFRFPYLVERRPVERDLAGMTQEAFFSEVLVSSYEQVAEGIASFLKEEQAKNAPASVEPLAFTWRIHRQRPQMRYTLASTIIREVMYGKYPVGDALPGLSRLAERYGVSMNTARRALGLLSTLGVIETRQGKKSYIRMEPAGFDIRHPEIREGLRLYLEALDFLLLTIEPVTRYTLDAIGPDGRAELLRGIAALRRDAQEHGCYEICFAPIAQHCPLSMVRECYARLLELLTWGYPLALSRLKGASLRDEYAAFLADAEEKLMQGDADGYAAAWKALIERDLRNARAFIQEEGAEPQ